MFQFLKNLFKRKEVEQDYRFTIGETRTERGHYRKDRAKFLHSQGLTTHEIADELGVARSTVYMYLGGIRNDYARPQKAS